MSIAKELLPYYNSFPLFVTIVWKSIGLPMPTKIQVHIAQTLQNPPNNRYIIEGFRGVAKSFLACAYVVWRLWRDEQLKIMIVSASKERADANAVFIKNIINALPFLEHLKARAGQRDTQCLFDVGGARPDASPSVKAVGITGQITGSRADVILADDVEITNNSITQTMRDKLFEAVKEFDAILKPGEDKQIIYLGTPQNEMSLYNELLNRGYSCIIYPVMYPESPAQRRAYGDRLASCIAEKYDSDPEKWSGKPTDPMRFDENEIYKRRLSYGKAGFALQFMLDTSLSDADKYPLKLSDFVVGMFSLVDAPMSLTWLPDPSRKVSEGVTMGLKGDAFYHYFKSSEEIQPYTYRMMVIDPSGRGKDETGYAVLYYLNGFIYIMEVGGLIGGYSDSTLQELAKIARKYSVSECVIEGNFGDGMYTNLFTPVLKNIYKDCGVVEVSSKGAKEVRIIDTLEPLLGSHRLCVTPDAIKHDYETATDGDYKYCFFYQLPRITKDKGSLIHDDRLDAVAIGCKYMVDYVGVDPEEGINTITEDWLEESMESLFNSVTETIGGVKMTVTNGEPKGYYSGIKREHKGYVMKHTK